MMSLQEQVRLAIETLEAEVKQLDELIGGLEAARIVTGKLITVPPNPLR